MRFKVDIILLTLIATSLMLLTTQCKKAKLSDDTFYNSKVMILGHRGMGQYYHKPGNTYESVYPATQIGADGCEIDIQLTRDSVLVLFHDHLLDGRTSGYGRVYEHSWAEVKGYKYLALQKDIYVNSADELFSKLPDIKHLYFSFDCELDDEAPDFTLYQAQYLRAVKRLCEKYGVSDNVMLEGGEDFLKAAQQQGLTNKLFLSKVLNEGTIDTAVANNFFGICCQVGDIGMNTEMAHAKGLYVMAYTPYQYYLNRSAISKSVDILQTDDPMSILKLFNRFNYEYVIP